MTTGPPHPKSVIPRPDDAAPLHIVLGSDGAAFETARGARERGYEALVLIPRGAQGVRSLPSDISARDLDDRNPAVLERVFKGATCVHYCCGTTSYPIDGEEPERLARILAAAADAGARFVYCDAAYAYGFSGRPLSEDLPQRARDPLGEFLAALAQFVLDSHRKRRVQAVVARHAELIGPQVTRSPFGEYFVERVLKAQSVTVPGRKDAARSLTYSRDLGRALILLSEQPEAAGQIWHVPSTPPVSAEKLVSLLRAVAGLPGAPAGLLNDTAARGPLGGMLAASSPERSLNRLHEANFTLLSTKFERAFGMHATPLKDLAQETVLSLSHA
jgi:nucleoside-diphosphate-sugar epimerase